MLFRVHNRGVAKQVAPEEKKVGRPGLTDEQIAHFRSKILERIPQGETLRQVLAGPGMCSMMYFLSSCCRMTRSFKCNTRARSNCGAISGPMKWLRLPTTAATTGWKPNTHEGRSRSSRALEAPNRDSQIADG